MTEGQKSISRQIQIKIEYGFFMKFMYLCCLCRRTSRRRETHKTPVTGASSSMHSIPCIHIKCCFHGRKKHLLRHRISLSVSLFLFTVDGDFCSTITSFTLSSFSVNEFFIHRNKKKRERSTSGK